MGRADHRPLWVEFKFWDKTEDQALYRRKPFENLKGWQPKTSADLEAFREKTLQALETPLHEIEKKILEVSKEINFTTAKLARLAAGTVTSQPMPLVGEAHDLPLHIGLAKAARRKAYKKRADQRLKDVVLNKV